MLHALSKAALSNEREIQQRKYSTRKMYTFTVVIVVRGAVEVMMVTVW